MVSVRTRVCAACVNAGECAGRECVRGGRRAWWAFVVRFDDEVVQA